MSSATGCKAVIHAIAGQAIKLISDVFWDKKLQPRATTSFGARNDVLSPPSSDDEESCFYASDFAETQYLISDDAIRSIGMKFEDDGLKKSTCGVTWLTSSRFAKTECQMTTYLCCPDHKPDVEPLYYTRTLVTIRGARAWAHCPGRLISQSYKCPYSSLNESHINRLAEQ